MLVVPRRGAARLTLVTGDVYRDWEAVYRDNVDRVYRLMFAKVGNRHDAEDLTAEVFVAALRPLRVSASVGRGAGVPVGRLPGPRSPGIGGAPSGGR